jgi:hypothetical protein
MHARHYNFNIGRFLTLDPVRGDPAAPQSFNLFAYVRNNPVNFVDPLGLDCVETSPGVFRCPSVEIDVSGGKEGFNLWRDEYDEWCSRDLWCSATRRTIGLPGASMWPARLPSGPKSVGTERCGEFTMRGAQPGEGGISVPWASPTAYVGVGGFAGLSYAVAAEAGVYASLAPLDLGLYAQVGGGGGWGGGLGLVGGAISGHSTITSPSAQVGAASPVLFGGGASFENGGVAGVHGALRGGAGFYGVATTTARFSLREFLSNVVLAVRGGC